MTTGEKGVTVPLWAMKDCKGDPRDGMLWAQITWWFQPAQRDGAKRTKHLIDRDGETWMYTTDAELAAQTGMSVDQVYRGRRALVKRELLVTRSALVRGQKVTLMRPTVDSVDEAEADDETAESRNPEAAPSRNLGTANTRDLQTAESRNPPIGNRGRRTEGSARGEAADERVSWQVPDVVARAGLLDVALELCDHWATRLEDRGVKVGERARSKAWAAPMEAMLRIDERDPVQVRRVIDWLEDGKGEVAAFWQGNVLSPDKLRAKWDQMAQQVRRERSRSAGRDRQSEISAEYVQAAQRLAGMEGR